MRRLFILHRRGGLRLPVDEGISPGLQGFTDYGGSITAFTAPQSQSQGKSQSVGGGTASTVPCGVHGTSVEAVKARHMANIALSGKLPSPRVAQQSGKPPLSSSSLASGSPISTATAVGLSVGDMMERNVSSSLPRRLPTSSKGLPITTSTTTDTTTTTTTTSTSTSDVSGSTSKLKKESAASDASTKEELRAKEAEDYYSAIPRNAISKEEMWKRIRSATTDKAERVSSALQPSEVDYLKMEEELKEHDLFHYRMGEIAYPETTTRQNYYAMWQLAMSLNKARWTMLDVHSQRGVKTTGAGMKLLFWKESVNQIMEKRQMSAGQFTDSHPVLRPFAAVVEQNPQMTKAFVRGFTDARLRVVQQPGNVKQLFDHFDRYYGYFFNSLLEITNVKDENAEHMLQHIGRAIGLTQHCVMFWKKYARIGFTMLPADLCADNHVNIALLKNISLASRDRAVRKLLYDVMCIVKTEMLHAEQLASQCPPTAWPIVMECTYANYYLGFLQRRDFNVSAMFADHNIENAGFAWYRLKKRWEWEKYQSIKRLVSEEAPLPFIGISLGGRGSNYKMASGISQNH
ncbi:hypothetical protein LSM04_003580 [Trypanosoma melophagium]|uniref:uncharacterized protein n=1 Tax=Trypanosoma melophagium TaxID=715481 RepID=UPI00351A0698|nr:hypothetical protein LSM04_003580 [Trypanosoma melophagium]